MAKVYRAPIAPPAFDTDFEKYIADEEAYIADLVSQAKNNGNHPMLGEEIRWQRGDGYARYIVWNTGPLELIWIETGDAWSVEEALIRGLNITEVKRMVGQKKALAELFSH